MSNLVPISGPEVIETLPARLAEGGPANMLVQFKQRADVLMAFVNSQNLYKVIGTKKHLLVEAWTFLGSLQGVFPVVCWTKPIEGGWEARVEARTMAGQVVGAAEAECLRSEANWKSRDDYALRSMAQTRATSKALRLPLGFIAVLAGFDATPYEEMVKEEKRAQKPPEEPTGPSLEDQLRRSLGEAEAIEVEADTVPPGHCTLKGCAGEVELYVSSQDRWKGREYWMCAIAHEERDRLLNEGATPKLANSAVSAHYREWAGPWKGQGGGEAATVTKVPSLPSENAPPPSIFDPARIEEEVRQKLAREAK